jgi:hypothetical protein
MMLDKNFNADRVIFGLKGLMKLINSEEKFPAGSVFLWDEFQIGASNRNWQSLTNKLLNQLLSTFRHKQFILLINSPYSDFCDSQTIKLLHAEFEILGIDFDKEETILKPQIIQYNSRKKKFYYKYLRIRNARGQVSRVNKWRIPKPPKWLTDGYEEKKTSFTANLNKSIEKQLQDLEGDDVTEVKKELTLKQREVYDSYIKHKGNVSEVAEEIGITSRAIYFQINLIKKKGFSMDTLGLENNPSISMNIQNSTGTL